MKQIALLLAVLQLVGCSVKYQISSNTTDRQRYYMNSSLKELPGRMTDKQRIRYYGTNFQVGKDSTSWQARAVQDSRMPPERIVMANLDLDSLVANDRRGGTRDGLITGALGGILLSGLFIAAFKKDCPVEQGDSRCDDEITFQNVVIGVIAGVGFGAGMGATIGASAGNQVQVHYDLNNPSPPNNATGVGR